MSSEASSEEKEFDPSPRRLQQARDEGRVPLSKDVNSAVQMIIGNVVEPKLLGDSLELHPITVLLSLIFWGMLWGLPGMLLAAPITAVLKILLESLDLTKPVANLLAGHLPSETSLEQESPSLTEDVQSTLKTKEMEQSQSTLTEAKETALTSNNLEEVESEKTSTLSEDLTKQVILVFELSTTAP